MITVEEAEKIIQEEARNYGAEIVPFDLALGRVLAEDIKADRDLPPFNRVMVDGIAISYTSLEGNIDAYRIKATQAAGDTPVELYAPDECIEIMTGAALPASADTVIRYEDLEINNGLASVMTGLERIKKGQNIHKQGIDKHKNDIVALSGQRIGPGIISMVASVGETELRLKKMPRVIVISSGDELVEVEQTPSPYQLRRSNSYMAKAILQQQGINAQMMHIPDEKDITIKQIQLCLQNFDVILISGGVSAGKFDYIPQALKELQVRQLFHKIKQRPGKPFWFGKHDNGTLVFAFPGNPVATFMCMHRYFLPWLATSLKVTHQAPVYAILENDIVFEPDLTYFLQVKLQINTIGQFIAVPVEGNGSGDFANLAAADAFMELPLGKSKFKKGEVYRIWPFA